MDADPVPQFRQSIMSDTSDVGSSRILAKSIPIVNSMVGGRGMCWGWGRDVYMGRGMCEWVGEEGTCLHGGGACPSMQVSTDQYLCSVAGPRAGPGGTGRGRGEVIEGAVGMWAYAVLSYTGHMTIDLCNMLVT